MATIINNPSDGTAERAGGSGGLIIGVLVGIILIAILFMYGLPALRGGTSGTNVNVPDKINVDVNSGARGAESTGGTAQQLK